MSIEFNEKNKIDLIFSLYIAKVWRFGLWGQYYCIGPLYFTKTPDSELEGTISSEPKKVASILDRTADYEYRIEGKYDVYVLHLFSGEVEERKFFRLSAKNDDGDHISKAAPESLTFAAKLKEKCGY